MRRFDPSGRARPDGNAASTPGTRAARPATARDPAAAPGPDRGRRRGRRDAARRAAAAGRCCAGHPAGTSRAVPAGRLGVAVPAHRCCWRRPRASARAAGGARLRCCASATGVTPYNQRLPGAVARCCRWRWSPRSALNRAYERRFLFVGTEEYQRVIRGRAGADRRVAIVSYALEIQLARGVRGDRAAGRDRRHRSRSGSCCASACTGARERGECLRRVVVVGHELAVVGLTRQLRRERYHGLEVVGACLPPPSSDGRRRRRAGATAPSTTSPHAVDGARRRHRDRALLPGARRARAAPAGLAAGARRRST